MKGFVLLPFYLYVEFFNRSSILDDDTWSHGPLVSTYNVNVTTTNNDSSMKSSGFNAVLKCCSQKFDTLNCRLDNVRMVFNDYNVREEYVDLQFDEPFRMEWFPSFLRTLIVSSQITSWKLNILRVISDQLIFGKHLLDKPDGTFEYSGKRDMYSCSGLVNVSREFRNVERFPRKENFEIIGHGKACNETVKIEQRRNRGPCRFKNYTFAEEQYDGKQRLVSSRSWVEISDTTYDSYTANVFNIEIEKNKTMIQIHEKIALNLISVLPSTEEPCIPSPNILQVDFDMEVNVN